jgi:GWxTD domain-containing protein
MMKKKIFSMKVLSLVYTFLCLFLLAGSLDCFSAPAKISVDKKLKQLDEKYQKWYELVYHIITPTERAVFFDLTTNRDRDAFISLFWNQRDPSKGTPDNEFRDEHVKRFNYASYYFGFGSPLPGWKTDRGKIYILLGPPVSRNEVITNGLYPVEIWEYFGGPKLGLPTAFRVVFYKKSGAGDYRLYLPTMDGPESLLIKVGQQIDPANYYKLYEEIKKINPEVAEASLSLIPGEPLENFRPSLQAPVLLSKIYDLPKRSINATYARNFLSYKGVVDVSVTTNYINSRGDLYVVPDPISRLHFVHFAILPERLSVDYSQEKDKYYFNYTLLVILKQGDTVVLQYSKNYPFYYTKEELDSVLSHGIVIADYFPVVAGDFKFSAVIENSVNREITYFERDLRVDSVDLSIPRMSGPLVTYQVNRSPQLFFSSFNFLEDQVQVDPRREFGLRESLFSFFCVNRGNYKGHLKAELAVRNLEGYREYARTYSFVVPEGEAFRCFKPQLENPNTGAFTIKARLIGEQGIILSAGENSFTVSPLAVIPHPPSASKKLARSNDFLLYMMLARQYQNLNMAAEAEANYEKAFGLNANYPNLLKAYAAFLLEQEKYDRLLDVIEGLKGREGELFDYYAYRGKAYYKKGNYNLAADNLLQANKQYDSDITVLNALAASLVQLGHIDEAKKVFAASLKIEAKQPDIAELLRRLNNNENQKKK